MNQSLTREIPSHQRLDFRETGLVFFCNKSQGILTTLIGILVFKDLIDAYVSAKNLNRCRPNYSLIAFDWSPNLPRNKRLQFLWIWKLKCWVMTRKIWHFAYGRAVGVEQIIPSFIDGSRDLHAQLPLPCSDRKIVLLMYLLTFVYT